MNGPNITFTGGFAIAVNSTNAPVDRSFSVGGQQVVLNLPAGPYLRIDGTGVALHIADQSLSGNFSIQRVTLADGTVSTAIAVSNVVADARRRQQRRVADRRARRVPGHRNRPCRQRSAATSR